MGEQDAADQRGAFACGAAPGGDPGGRLFLWRRSLLESPHLQLHCNLVIRMTPGLLKVIKVFLQALAFCFHLCCCLLPHVSEVP